MNRTSILNNEEAVKRAVLSSPSKAEALKKLGLRAAGGNYKALDAACERYGIEKIVFRRPPGPFKEPIPDSEVFVVNSTATRASVKKRLYRMGVPRLCNECGQGETWNGKPLSLTLEHKNGVWNDNRLENLCILCPNCHSQTDTFAGKGLKKKKTARPRKARPRKIEWPSKIEVAKMVSEKGYSATGRELGVSDNAVRKYLMPL